MKRLAIFACLLFLTSAITVTQTYEAAIAIEDQDISGLLPGDRIFVPLLLKTKSAGLIYGFQFFINFDHTALSWDATWENPLTAMKDFHKTTPYSEEDWLFNDTGEQLAMSWTDPEMYGVDIPDGAVICVVAFTFNGGIEPGNDLILSWGETTEVKDGSLIKGITEMYSEKLDYFILTKESGKLKY